MNTVYGNLGIAKLSLSLTLSTPTISPTIRVVSLHGMRDRVPKRSKTIEREIRALGVGFILCMVGSK